MRSPQNLLFVDDDPVTLKLLGSILNGLGELYFSTSGAEALERVAERPFDVILLDALMPDMDGLATCRLLHERHPEIPVIFITGARDHDLEIRALESGAVDFINKPLDPTVVRVRVAAHLRLKRQSEEIRRAKNSLQEAETQRERLQERQRLAQDMHDGFGTKLATARMHIRAGTATHEETDAVLQACIEDLHLVSNVFENFDGRLSMPIAYYRHRMTGRLRQSPVEFGWQVEVDDCPALDVHRTLQFMRILQEGVSNALRHADATRIQVEIGYSPDKDQLDLLVRDDGVGIPEAALTQSSGTGFTDMRRRAREIGGQLDIRPLAKGSEIRLGLPLNPTTG